MGTWSWRTRGLQQGLSKSEHKASVHRGADGGALGDGGAKTAARWAMGAPRRRRIRRPEWLPERLAISSTWQNRPIAATLLVNSWPAIVADGALTRQCDQLRSTQSHAEISVYVDGWGLRAGLAPVTGTVPGERGTASCICGGGRQR
jgi:hypothetical protein